MMALIYKENEVKHEILVKKCFVPYQFYRLLCRRRACDRYVVTATLSNLCSLMNKCKNGWTNFSASVNRGFKIAQVHSIRVSKPFIFFNVLPAVPLCETSSWDVFFELNLGFLSLAHIFCLGPPSNSLQLGKY